MLSKQISKEKEWKDLDPEEKAWMKDGLQARKDAKVGENKVVRMNPIIESFSTRLDTEVCVLTPPSLTNSHELTGRSRLQRWLATPVHMYSTAASAARHQIPSRSENILLRKSMQHSKCYSSKASRAWY